MNPHRFCKRAALNSCLNGKPYGLYSPLIVRLAPVNGGKRRIEHEQVLRAVIDRKRIFLYLKDGEQADSHCHIFHHEHGKRDAVFCAVP